MAEGATSDHTPEHDIASAQGGEDASGGSVGGERRGAMRGGHDPVEMARKSAEVRARKRQEREAQEAAGERPPVDGKVRLVTTPIEVGAIMSALQKEAKKGTAQAARELRAWLSEYPPQDDTLRAEDLPVERRRAVLARLNAEIAAEEAAQA